MKTGRHPHYFDPIVRNAAQEADQQRDRAALDAGMITPQALTARNACIPPHVDLSCWVCTRIDESAWDDLGI